MPVRVFEGRQIAAARALANISTAELAGAAGVTPRTVGRLEVDAAIHISPKRRHGHVSQEVFDRITAALAQRGVRLMPEGENHGAGVRWIAPRARRRSGDAALP